MVLAQMHRCLAVVAVALAGLNLTACAGDSESTSEQNQTESVRVLISEIQTRGAKAGNDEFVELYNPLPTPVTLDDTWQLVARSAVGKCESNKEAVRFRFSGQTIPPGGHM